MRASVMYYMGMKKWLLVGLFLSLVLLCLTPRPLLALNQEPMLTSHLTTGGLVAVGEYINLAENKHGQYRLQRIGRTVMADFRASRSPVQYFARQKPSVLFTIPEGFRPDTEVIREVEGQFVDTHGVPLQQPTTTRKFRVSIAPDGSVRYVDDDGVEGVGYLAYAFMLNWKTPETSGYFDYQAEHHQGSYSLRREGQAVQGSFSTVRSPVQHYARQEPAVLFTLPPGFRPVHTTIVTVDNARHVTIDGIPHPDFVETQRFDLRISPDGTVRYLDNSFLDEVGYLQYRVNVAWATNDPVLLEQ